MPCIPEGGHPKTSRDLNKEELENILSSDETGFQIQEEKNGERLSEFNNDNFQSCIQMISLISTQGESVHIVIKETMNDAPSWFRWIHSTQRAFYRECLWYKVSIHLLAEAWPIIHDLSPKCYYAYHNYKLSLDKPWIWRNKEVRPPVVFCAEKSMILLENLTKREKESERYTRLNLYSFIDVEVALSALRSLGHFHGIWWQFLNRKNPKFNYTPGLTPEDYKYHFNTQDDSRMFLQWFKPFFKMYGGICRTHLSEPEGPDLERRILAYFKTGKLFDLTQRTLLNTSKEKSLFKTMVHGDSWRNNMLWRPSDNHVVLIDYQGQMMAHPGRDFWYFIYSSSDKSWRDKHLESCKTEYFRVYSSYLDKTEGLDFESFNYELEELRGASLMMSMCVEVISKYPKEFNKQSLFILGKDYKEAFKTLQAPPAPSDHPSLNVIRDRLIDTARDLRDLNVI